MSAETINISVEEYERLLDADHELSVLYACGVDNWEWYDEAIKQFNNEKKEAN